MIRLLILTGQRSGEIRKLRWSEVNLVDRIITKLGADGKKGKAKNRPGW